MSKSSELHKAYNYFAGFCTIDEKSKHNQIFYSSGNLASLLRSKPLFLGNYSLKKKISPSPGIFSKTFSSTQWTICSWNSKVFFWLNSSIFISSCLCMIEIFGSSLYYSYWISWIFPSCQISCHFHLSSAFYCVKFAFKFSTFSLKELPILLLLNLAIWLYFRFEIFFF